MPDKKKKLIKWQLPMKRVLFALAPVVIASVYFFGLRVLALLALVTAVGFLCEYIFTRRYNEPVTSALFVTTTLYTLSLPPTIPFRMAVVGIAAAVVFGKMVFGGFGKNVFNPAMVGRAFIYVTFPAAMTGSWVKPASGFPAGFGAYFDGVSSATILQSGAGEQTLVDAIIGSIPGSIGETSAILLLLGGIYIIYKKAANYRIVLSGIISMLAIQSIFFFSGISDLSPLFALFSGGFMLGVFFIATDPVSAAQTNEGRWIFGAIVGGFTVLIRTFSSWPEGFMFAILLGNMFAPILDYGIKNIKKRASA